MSLRLDAALVNLRFAHGYAVGLIDAVPAADWFRVPSAGISHVGWQVGHLAMARYRLLIERVRGARPEDAELLPPLFLAAFGRDSVVSADAGAYPSAADIRAVYDRVTERALADMAMLSDATLDEPALTPHKFCRTKLDCLNWCSHHEMVHAGQIGLLRRQLGERPLW